MQSGLLQKLVGVPHVIQLKAFGMCSYLGDNWHAVLVQPFVTLLTPADTLQLVGQVGEECYGYCATCGGACDLHF